MSDPTHHDAEPAATPPAHDPAQEPPLADPALIGGETVPPAPPNRGSGLLPVIYVVGLIVLIGGLVWLWRNPTRESAPPEQTAAIDQLRDQTTVLAQQVQDLQGRIAALEKRPVPTSVDLGPLEARITALEKRPSPPAASTQGDQESAAAIAALSAKIDQLGKTQSATGDLAARVDQLARAQAGNSELAARVDQLARTQAGAADLGAKVNALAQSQQSAEADLAHRLDALAAQTEAGQRAAAQLRGLADSARRTARLQAAQATLDAGQKLGPIDGAPPALARFADAPPPTEAALRLSFPAAARAAERASRPELAGKPFLTRVWLRMQEAVTVRQDDRVIVGDPAAGTIARAQRALDAGDLAGAVSALSALQGPAAQAMAGWLDRARSLLAARAALAAMTTSG